MGSMEPLFHKKALLIIYVCPDRSSVCEGSGSESTVLLEKGRVIP